MFSSISDSFTLVTLQFTEIFISFPVFFGILLCIIAGNLAAKLLRILLFVFCCFIPPRNLRVIAASLAYCYAVAYVWERNELSKKYAGTPPNPSIIRTLSHLPKVFTKIDPSILKLFNDMSRMPRGLWVDVGAGTEIMTGFLPRVRGYQDIGLKVNRRDKLVL